MTSGDKVTQEELLDYIAPCSLLCYTCPGFVRGVVCGISEKLLHYLEGYYNYQVSYLPPEYNTYAEIIKDSEKHLGNYTKPKCGGCRNGNERNNSAKDCFIPGCVEEHGVDFCGECIEFPCKEVDTKLFFPKVFERWLRGNRRIQEIGAMQFFMEEREKPHYLEFAEDNTLEE